MLRAVVMAASLMLATVAGAQYEATSSASAEAQPPERRSNRKIRMMGELAAERRKDMAANPGAYSDYSYPERTVAGKEPRGYFAWRGNAPANAGGNAFGQNGSAYPSDGGRAFPTVPPNR